MPRIARKSFETNYFHVMVQGIAREYIFASDALKDAYIDNIIRFKDDFAVKVLGYCFMDNHAHLLLYAPNVEMLSRFMRNVNTRFAQYYNLTCDRVGYVFRDRFKSQAIFDTKYLLNCLNYIHKNPVCAEIVTKMENYQYSSYGCYMRGNGLIDLSAASELYDCSAENISAISDELNGDEGCPVWIDCDDVMKENRDKQIMKILRGLHIPPQYVQLDKELLNQTVKSLRGIGCTLREIAELLDISAAWVGKICSEK